MNEELPQNTSPEPAGNLPNDELSPAPEPESSPPSKEQSAGEGNGDHQRFPIIALGASAGGLEAFERFFDNMPPDSGMAFVIISHLDPDRQSMLSGLLSNHTEMEVKEVVDQTPVEPNKVYIIPPNKYLRIEKRVLLLRDPEEPRGLRMSVDYFFRSLAEDQGERAVAVVLSGSGTDGTIGIRAINALGGVAMVQDPVTAAYDGMPTSAIATGLADFVLPVEKMPEHLLSYAKHYFQPRARIEEDQAGPRPSPLNRIFALVRARTGHDFSQYKRSTTQRRIERRMGIHKLEDPFAYLQHLERHPDEIQTLFRELLIGVTGFFRDPEAFEALKSKILPRLLEHRNEQSPIRIWVPACATGEEVYSLAIILQEYIEESQREFRIQIFGTDIDDQSIEQARSALYSPNIALDITPKRLARFFNKTERGYQVKKDIREHVVFAVHNVIKDAPFTKLDILSCRNLLIYFQIDLQNRLLPFFHYSLRPGGVLFLGNSESVGAFVDLFQVLDKKWKFFERRNAQPFSHYQHFPDLAWTAGSPAREQRGKGAAPGPEPDILDLTRKMLLQGFAPPCVTINPSGDILYIHGQAGKYLEPAQGRISTNLLSMAREELKNEMRSVLSLLGAGAKDHVSSPIQVRTNEGPRTLQVVVRQVVNQELFWVIFQELNLVQPPESGSASKAKSKDRSSNKRMADLETELQRTKATLQATLEEHQASTEELRSTNEELQSTNEELQSTNEELETSKEELQSLNEELVTVNSELIAKIEQLSKIESDMKNLLDSLRVGIIFLDSDLRIKRYTTEATRLIHLLPTDVGRPLGHLASNLDYESLLSQARAVLDSLVPKEMEVCTRQGDWYLMRILPYRTLENLIDGLVLTFDNINQIKSAGLELARLEEETRKFAENIIETSREPFLILDTELRVYSANALFYQTFQVTPEQTLQQYLYHLGEGQWNIPTLRGMLQKVVGDNTHFQDFVVDGLFPKLGRLRMLLNARMIRHQGLSKDMILLAMEDVTGKERGSS